MKKILKVLSLIMVLVLSMSVFTACETDNPEDTLKAAFEKMESLNDFDAGMNMNLKMNSAGMEISVSGEMDIKACDVKDNITAIVDGNINILGTQQKISLYIADKVMYINTGSKLKIPMDNNISEETSSESTNEKFDIPTVDLKMKTENGNKIITGIIKAEEVSKILKNAGKAMESISGEEMIPDTDNLKTSDISFTVTVNADGYISAMDLKLDAEMKEDTELSAEMNYSMTVDIKIQFNNIGKKPEITAPSDLGSYMSMEEYQNSIMQQYAGLNTGDLEGFEDTDFNLDDFNLDDLE